MRLIIPIILPIAVLLSCAEDHKKGAPTVAAAIKPAATEASKEKNQLFRQGYYLQSNSLEPSFILDSVESGYDSMQIRLWVSSGLSGFRRLFVLRNTQGAWQATHLELELDANYANGNGSRAFLSGPEPLTVKKVQHPKPKHGWKPFLDSLYALKVLALPDMEDIKGMEVNWTHPTGYFVEVATKGSYRFYRYYDPERFADQFWQAKNMDLIQSLFFKEFSH